MPKRIVLDLDDTFDAVHGGQQLRLFNGHYDEYGFQPIVVVDGDGRFVTAMLRPAKRPGGAETAKFLRRLLRAIRANWPATQILIRADSHYCCPEVMDSCRANGLDFILGAASTLITSQLPVDKWHDVIGEPTFADAILDRLVHNSYRLELDGPSMRKTRPGKGEKTA